MARFLATRLLSLVASLLLASLVIFAVIEVIPGDPVRTMLGISAREDTMAALRVELGLDMSRPQRYLHWLLGMLRGDLGVSYTWRVPVAELVAQRLTLSLPLALYALALTVALAFPAGLWAAARRGRVADAAVMGATQLGLALPNFWFAMLMILLFAIHLGWFAAGGFPGWSGGWLAGLRALTLPAVALALPQASILARVLRSELIDTLAEDYIRTARAKGLSRGQALRRHALRNALLPVLTIMGLQFAFLIAGAIIIEQVFALPGLGALLFQAIQNRDLIVVESVVMLLVLAVIVVNFAVDLTYAAIDPRLRG